MALNEMEFLGNNRYFKYRYAQETPVNVTTLEESWVMESRVLQYNAIADYLKRSLNIKYFSFPGNYIRKIGVIYEGNKVNFEDLSKVITEVDAFSNATFILFPVPRALFYGRHEYFTPSPVYESARTIIVSGAPKRVLSTSLSFLNMETPVLISIVSTVVILALLLVVHSIVTNKYKSLHTRKFVKKMAQKTLGNVWDNASLFCAEPIPTVLPHITCRLLAASWLIGVTFILFFLGCYLRTEFTTESYNRIDTLSDLIKSGIPPLVVKNGGAFDSLKYLAAQDPDVNKWFNALDQENMLTGVFDYLTRDGYLPVLFGEKAVIVEDTYLNWLAGEFLKLDPESKKFFSDHKGFYISEHEISFEYLHFVFQTSWLRSSPQVHESLQLSVVPMFETQALNYLDFEKLHFIEQVRWKRPLKSTTDLDLSSVGVPFYFLFLMLSGTVAAVISEIIFNLFALSLKI